MKTGQTAIDEEYISSAGDMDEESDDEKPLQLASGTCSDEDIDDELFEIGKRIKQRDMKYAVNNQSTGTSSHVSRPKDVLNVVKRTAEKEKSEEKRYGNKTQGKLSLNLLP